MLKRLYLFGWKAMAFLILLLILFIALIILIFKIVFIIFPVIVIVLLVFLFFGFSKNWFKKTKKRKDYVDAKYKVKR
tara:strand:+ start:212 stop:442 length:231 start_codon:yes stop_codon:yes gene_type:complete